MDKNNNLQIDFIGIGGMRCGSSWIFQCIKEHPEVCNSSRKELNFFDKDNNYKKGIEGYYKPKFEKCPPDKIKGEFSPTYLHNPRAPYRIQSHFPNTKLIVSLRDPIERAYSQYRYGKAQNKRMSIYKNFHEAIKKDSELVQNSLYHEKLKKFFELFPENNILVIHFEEIRNYPDDTIKKIYKFLELNDVDFTPSPLNKKRNQTGDKMYAAKIPYINSLIYKSKIKLYKNKFFFYKIKPFLEKAGFFDFGKKIIRKNRKQIDLNTKTINIPLSSQDRKSLLPIFKKDIENLENLLNKDLTHWKN